MPTVHTNNILKILENVLQESNLEKYIVLSDFNLHYLIFNWAEIVHMERETKYLLEIIKTY